MKIMVVGGGGREHAIIKKIKENKNVTEIFALPGNGGMKDDATLVNIGAKDIDAIVNFAVENKIDFAVVAPDDPLVLGAVDALNSAGIKCFGPTRNAAIIEGSKAFSKNLMKKYNIPTAAFEIFNNAEDALKYLETAPVPTVVKADGLALGKGVIIAVNKWDAVEDKDDKTIYRHTEKIREVLSFVPYADIIFISALTGQRMHKLFEHIETVIQNQNMRIGTGVLNEIMMEAVSLQQPPSDKGKRLKLYYITQVAVKPPTFVIFVNDKELMHFSYTRYLENRIRDTFGFKGTALKFITRERKEDK